LIHAVTVSAVHVPEVLGVLPEQRGSFAARCQRERRSNT
jgi:hypothetical protein